MRRALPRVPLYGLVAVVAAAVLSLVRPPFLANLEYSAFDALARSAPTRRPSGRVVIVDIDERSLAALGQWPWRRDRIGELIGGIRDLGAGAIALDIIFAEPDRLAEAGVDPDVLLADALGAGRVILGYGLTFEDVRRGAAGTRQASGSPHGCVQHALGLVMVGREADDDGDAPFFHATGAICNLLPLTRAASASGFLNAAPDADGILRRVPLVASYGGQVYPALSLASVRQVTGTRHVALHTVNAHASSLHVGDRGVRLDGKANLLLRYRGPKRTFDYVSAADVMTGHVAPGAFAGKIVFVGTTALGTREVVSTPLDTLFTGVEVQATAADNLLQGDFLWRPDAGVALETVGVFVLGLFVVLVARRFGVPAAAVAAAGCIAGAWGLAHLLLAGSGAVLSPLFPTIGLCATVAVMTGAGLLAERNRAEQAGAAHADSQRLMIQTLLSLTEIRDTETGQHSRRTQEYTRLLAEHLAGHPAYRRYLTSERIDLLATLAPLHDIGKVGVPDRLLHKPGPLTPDELDEMRNHPTYGRDVILNAERDAGVRDDATLAMAKDIVYTHHEKWDGTGYPQGLRGAEIPIPGRLMAVVDVYDAVRTRKLYGTPVSQHEAVALIVRGKGTHFDPAVVEAFLRVSPVFDELSAMGAWGACGPPSAGPRGPPKGGPHDPNTSPRT
jgi:adenylate cyclase